MAKQVRLRRGSTVDHTTTNGGFTGGDGEITVDSTKDTLVVHDNATVGGFPLAREDLSNVTNAVGIQQFDFTDGIAGQVLTTDGNSNLSFINFPGAGGSAVGGDLSGTVANAQINNNTVGIPELDVADGFANYILTTNGAGTLAFQDSQSLITVDGDLSGTLGNLQIKAGVVGSNEISSNAITSDKITNLNILTEKIADLAITDAKIDGMNASKLSGTTLPALDGTALTSLPYDIGFIGGFDADLIAEDLEVAIYGQLVMARSGTFEGQSGFVDVAGLVQPIIVDIEKNGTSIYTTKPFFATSDTAMTNGVLDVNNKTFVSGDRITFKVTQIGTGTVGQGARFTLKCRV